MSGRVVFTVGSVLRGDDAAGPMLAKIMEQEPVEGWEVIDGGQTPEDFLATIRRCQPDFLLLVDAASMGIDPGAVRILDEENVKSDYLITTHSLPLSFVLSELRSCCGQVLFLGIQIAQSNFYAPLTPQVRQAVEDIYRCLSRGDGIDRFPRLVV